MKIILSVSFFLLSALAIAQNKGLTYKDLRGLQGNWAGQTITTGYLDKKQVTFQTTLVVIDMIDSIRLTFNNTEPNGKSVTNKNSMRIYEDGKKLGYDGEEFDIAAVRRNGERLIVIVEREGTDNKKPVDFRYTFIIGPAVFNIQEETKYEGDEKYFVTNKIQLTKK